MTKAEKQWLLFGGGILLLAMATKARAGNAGANTALMNISYLGTSGPRGVRNNNPGNIRMSNSPWQGKVPHTENSDGAFEQFVGYVWGVRAMIKLLQNYMGSGYDTLSEIINRYAPAEDSNDVGAYVNAVSQKTGFAPNQILSPDYDTMSRLVPAMAAHENGQEAIDNAMFGLAWHIL